MKLRFEWVYNKDLVGEVKVTGLQPDGKEEPNFNYDTLSTDFSLYATEIKFAYEKHMKMLESEFPNNFPLGKLEIELTLLDKKYLK